MSTLDPQWLRSSLKATCFIYFGEAPLKQLISNGTHQCRRSLHPQGQLHCRQSKNVRRRFSVVEGLKIADVFDVPCENSPTDDLMRAYTKSRFLQLFIWQYLPTQHFSAAHKVNLKIRWKADVAQKDM